MTHSRPRTFSPSSRKITRNTPCVAGCCGPMLMTSSFASRKVLSGVSRSRCERSVIDHSLSEIGVSYEGFPEVADADLPPPTLPAEKPQLCLMLLGSRATHLQNTQLPRRSRTGPPLQNRNGIDQLDLFP